MPPWGCTVAPLQLATGSILVAGLLSVYLYAASFGQGKMLAAGGNSDYHVYNFFIGRELNPRFSGSNFDLKEFCELKPGLIGWVVRAPPPPARAHTHTHARTQTYPPPHTHTRGTMRRVGLLPLLPTGGNAASILLVEPSRKTDENYQPCCVWG